MKLIIRKILIFASILLMISNLFGCRGIDFENQKTATAKELPLGEVMIFIAEEKNKYENRFDSEIWNLKSGDGNTFFKDYVVYTVKKFVEKIMMLKLAANELNVIISVKDDDLIKEAANEYKALLSNADLEFIGCTDDDIYNSFKDYHISRLVVDNLSKNASSEISISEAKVISVQYIKMSDRELAYKTVEDVKAKGASFAYFAKTRSSDTSIEMLIKRGDENSVKFPELFYLSSGQISDVLQYRNDYYIFKCTSDFLPNETEKRRLEILRSMKNTEFADNFQRFENEYRVISNSNYWRNIDLSLGNDSTISQFENIYYKYFPKKIK